MKKSGSITNQLLTFRRTGNILFLARACRMLARQKRIHEACYGLRNLLFTSPSIIHQQPELNTDLLLETINPLMNMPQIISRQELVRLFGNDFAVSSLPEDFNGARTEAIIINEDYLLIGEYAQNRKRIAIISPQFCLINDFYADDPLVRHIHALHKSPGSGDVLVSTGDASKYLDLWEIQDHSMFFKKRLQQGLAGHTAILKMTGRYYLGSDLSYRPNFIERLGGRKYYFPVPANRMYVVRFLSYQNRYLVSLNRELGSQGGRMSLSVFDTISETFVLSQLVFPNRPVKLDSDWVLTMLRIRSGLESDQTLHIVQSDTAVA